MLKDVAGVILIRKDGSVLLQHRDDKPHIFYPGLWCYPGGGVEIGETFEEAARRELFEETGYTAHRLVSLGAPNYARPDGQEMRPHAFWALYDEKQQIECREGQELVFVHPHDFEAKTFIPTQKDLLFQALDAARIANPTFAGLHQM